MAAKAVGDVSRGSHYQLFRCLSRKTASTPADLRQEDTNGSVIRNKIQTDLGTGRTLGPHRGCVSSINLDDLTYFSIYYHCTTTFFHPSTTVFQPRFRKFENTKNTQRSKHGTRRNHRIGTLEYQLLLNIKTSMVTHRRQVSRPNPQQRPRLQHTQHLDFTKSSSGRPLPSTLTRIRRRISALWKGRKSDIPLSFHD